MSPRLAPPVARQGDPKNPRRKRRAIKPPKLETREVGTERATNMMNVSMYGGLRPMAGTSDIDEKIMGPVPSAIRETLELCHQYAVLRSHTAKYVERETQGRCSA